MVRFIFTRLRLGLFSFVLILTACALPTPAEKGATASPPLEPIQPPVATLTIDDHTQTAGIGSYCWSDNQGIQKLGLCVDLIGIPTALEPLITSNTPYTAHFHLPLNISPDSVYVSVMPAVSEIINPAQNEFREWGSSPGWSGALPLKSDIEYEFQEGPGLYILQLNVQWKKYGDVSYGFLVQVGQGNENPPAVSMQLPASSAPTPALVNLSIISPLTRLGKGNVFDIAPSPQKNLLAISTSLGVYLYETTSQKEIWFRSFNGTSRNLSFNPDGTRLIIGITGNILPIVDAQNGKTVMELEGEEGIHGVWSPDGKFILTSAGCEQVLVWDARSGKMTQTVQPSKCNNVTPGYVNAAWSWDGKRIYVNSNYGYVSAWDTATYQPLEGYQANPPESTFGFDFAPSTTQNLFALENGLNVALLDGETGKIVKQLAGSNKATPFHYISWSPNGKAVLADDHLWDTETGALLKTFDDFIGLAWLPDGDTLIGISYLNVGIKGVSASTGELLFKLANFGLVDGYSTIPTWDGDHLLTFNGSYETRWNAANGQLLEQRFVASQPGWVSTGYASLSPDGRFIAAPNVIRDSKTRLEILQLHDANQYDKVAWSPDGTRIVSGQSLGMIDPVIWDSQIGKVLSRLSLHVTGFRPYLGALAWSPDGKWIAAGGSLMDPNNGFDDGMIVLWDSQTGAQTQLLTAGMKSERIQALAWSPSQRWLAAGSTSSKIFLWDMQTFTPISILIGHTDQVLGLSWSPNGTLLASTSLDGTVLVWESP